MLSISGKSSSASVVSLAVRRDDKPKTDKSSVADVKKDTTPNNQPDALTLSVPVIATVPAKTADDKSTQATDKAHAAPSENSVAKAAEKLVAELERTKEIVIKLDWPKSEDTKSEKEHIEQPKSNGAKPEKGKADEPLPPAPESKPPSDLTGSTTPTSGPPKPIEPTPTPTPAPAPIPSSDSTPPISPPKLDGSSSGGSTSTSGTTTYVLVKVRESIAKGKDLTNKFDTLQAQFNALSDKVDDLNAVTEKLDKLTARFEKLIKVMFQGGSGKGGNLNLANLNAALAVARLSQNVALGFGGGGSNGGGISSGLLQNLSGIGGFVKSQNLLLQNKGLAGKLQSVAQLKKSFESQLASLSDQLQELGSSLDAKA